MKDCKEGKYEHKLHDYSRQNSHDSIIVEQTVLLVEHFAINPHLAHVLNAHNKLIRAVNKTQNYQFTVKNAALAPISPSPSLS
jgi:hypothetical protein